MSTARPRTRGTRAVAPHLGARLLLALGLVVLSAAAAADRCVTGLTAGNRQVPCDDTGPIYNPPPPPPPSPQELSNQAERRAYDLEEAGRRQEAIEAYLEAIRLDGRNAGAHNNLGVIYDKMGWLQDAIAYFREAYRLEPANELYRSNLSSAINSLGNWHWDEGRLDEAERAYREALSVDPGNGTARDNLAKLAEHREDLKVQAIYDRGFEAMQSGRDREAVERFREFLRMRPNNKYGWRELGVTLMSLGDHDGAIAAFEKAAALGSEEAGWHLEWLLEGRDMARAESLTGEDRVAAYQRIISRYEDINFNAHEKLAETLIDLGRFDEAEQVYREIDRHRPGQLGMGLYRIEQARGAAHAKRGKALAQAGRHRDAERAYREALKMSPGRLDYQNKLGLSLLEQGRDAAAAAAFRDGARWAPQEYVLQYNLAVALFRIGRYAEAEEAARKAAALRPDDPEGQALLRRLHDHNTSVLRNLDPVIETVEGWRERVAAAVGGLVTSLFGGGDDADDVAEAPPPEGQSATAADRPSEGRAEAEAAPGAFGALEPPPPTVAEPRGDEPSDWMSVPEPVAKAVKKGLEEAKLVWERAKTEAGELAKSTGIAWLAGKIPGAAEFHSLVEDAKALYKGYSKAVTGIFARGMKGTREGVETLGGSRADDGVAERHDEGTEKAGKDAQEMAEDLSKKAIGSDH